MTDLTRVNRELELHMAKDDPVQTAYLKGKHAGEDRAYYEVLGLVAAILFFILALGFADKISAEERQEDTFLEQYEPVDEDEPDQDPYYDEADPYYDELDDLDSGEEGPGCH